MNNYSTYPVTNDFGFTYWSLMIPPFKPEHTLILGYGDGTIADLISLVWDEEYPLDGYIKATGVDIVEPKHNLGSFNDFLLEDARLFLEKSGLHNKYDYIVVDIFLDNKVPQWVKEEKFMKDLAATATNSKMIAFNSFCSDPLLPYISQYFNIELVKELRGNEVVFARPR